LAILVLFWIVSRFIVEIIVRIRYKKTITNKKSNNNYEDLIHIKIS